MTDWLKQEEELFPDISWSKPQNKQQAGKLLIVGGNMHEFSNVAQAYSSAERAGAGDIKVVLPDKLPKLLQGSDLPIQAVASTSSGGISKESLEEIKGYCNWADYIFLCGQLGKNSETQVLLNMLEGDNYVLVDDAIDMAEFGFKKDKTLVASFNQLQEIFSSSELDTTITSNMNLPEYIDRLVELDMQIVTWWQGLVIVVANKKVSTTKLEADPIILGAYSSTYLMQNRNNFEALTSAVWGIKSGAAGGS